MTGYLTQHFFFARCCLGKVPGRAPDGEKDDDDEEGDKDDDEDDEDDVNDANDVAVDGDDDDNEEGPEQVDLWGKQVVK